VSRPPPRRGVCFLALAPAAPHAAAQSGRFENMAEIYLMGAGMSGTVGVGSATADIDVPSSKIFDNLKFAVLADYRGQAPTWAVSADVVYILPLALGALLAAPVFAQDAGAPNPAAAAKAFPKRGFSPYAGRSYPTRVLWGDEHVHTGWSVDAGAFAGGGDNLHRNVIYRDGKDKADQAIPMTTFDSENPEDLWKWMAMWEAKTGGSLLAIPHNGNLSNGKMFALATFKGDPLTKEWAETRARWEPMYEATQIKGDGETHPTLSPTDEFANFERWDAANLAGVPKKPGMLEREYARQALKEGLKLEEKLGVNPFKFGLASGTDTHTGLTTAEEDNFFGKHTGVEPSPTRWEHAVIKTAQVNVVGWQMSASGYTGIWATANTREAIWDALKRKEAYSTTGPRISVRFFGGWDFDARDARTRMPAEAGYSKGVPMGGDLRQAPAGKAPTFLVAALKDPLSGNLDRYQIVKGWMDAKGELLEKVYDVAWSGDRKPDMKTGKLPAVGNTVDVADASWTNTIGAPELIAAWKDPDFDPKQRAFYYGRVIEIPTPRWTAYEAKRFGVQMPKEVPMTLQERA